MGPLLGLSLMCLWRVIKPDLLQPCQEVYIIVFKCCATHPINATHSFRNKKNRLDNLISLRVETGKCVSNDCIKYGSLGAFALAQKGRIQQKAVC